jgi:small-conductance mechanosensitive channel
MVTSPKNVRIDYLSLVLDAQNASMVPINLSSLLVLGNAVGVGVGLGLQNIANNFVSGIVLLVERPIKLGDRACQKGS